MTAYVISDVGAVADEDQTAWKADLALAPAAIEKSPEYAEALKLLKGTGLQRRLICVEGASVASADDLLRPGLARPME